MSMRTAPIGPAAISLTDASTAPNAACECPVVWPQDVGCWPCKGFTRMVLPGYTDAMKTAISVPDDTFEQATRQAAELGISRSEFFARAARRYLDELASRSLTQQVNDALQAAGDDDSAAAAAHAGRELLAAGEDW
jgi:Ribbon-helix-helix protein, copG family